MTLCIVQAACSYIIHSFHAGQPLKQINEKCSIYSKQMKELKKQQTYFCTLVFWQTVSYLLGSGSQETFSKDLAEVNLDDETVVILCMHSFRMGMFVVSGDYEKAAELFVRHGFAWPREARFQPAFMTAVCNGGFAASVVAGSSRKFKKVATKARALVKRWAAKGNSNVKHWGALLDAEGNLFQGRRRKAEQNYQSAIALSERGGYTQNCALAHERYGTFLLVDSSDTRDAAFHLSKAIELYSQWGAARKVEEMHRNYSSVLE